MQTVTGKVLYCYTVQGYPLQRRGKKRRYFSPIKKSMPRNVYTYLYIMYLFDIAPGPNTYYFQLSRNTNNLLYINAINIGFGI